MQLDSKSSTTIEATEDAIGDEVFYAYLKKNPKIVEDVDVDDEQSEPPQALILRRIRAIENRLNVINSQHSHIFEYLDCLVEGLQVIVGNQIRIPERLRFDVEESFDDSIDPDMSSKSGLSVDEPIDDRPTTLSADTDNQVSEKEIFPPRRDSHWTAL